MGLFDFVKNAGAKLFGKDTESSAEAEGNSGMSREDIDSAKADELIKAVQSYNIKIDSLYVAVEDDLATIAGTAASNAEREKAVLIVGNVTGIARVDDQLKVEKDEPKGKFHTVVSGDSLSKIAKAHYGDPMKYPVIFEANKPMLSHPDKIYPGQSLRIPQLQA